MLKPKEEIVEKKFYAKAVGSSDLWEKFKEYGKLTINDEMKPFTDETVEAQENKAEYGVLELLEGTWVSYKSDNDKEYGRIGTGVHTTIMPSPGVNLGTIPGKYSFECEEYIEALTFSLVPGGIRNRGGVSEQFCGAVKYEQSIKSVNKIEGQKDLKYTPIHEENGMYLWLSDLYNHAATAKSIEEDRGILTQSEEDRIKYKFKGEYKDETLVKIKNAFLICALQFRQKAHILNVSRENSFCTYFLVGIQFPFNLFRDFHYIGIDSHAYFGQTSGISLSRKLKICRWYCYAASKYFLTQFNFDTFKYNSFLLF